MRWLVYGEGALSGLIAAKLQQQHQYVMVATRSGTPPQAFILNQESTIELNAFDPAQTPDVVIAALKAYDIETWLEQARQHAWYRQIPLILSYNGMLIAEESLLPANSFHWVTTHGAFRDGAQLNHAGQGESWLGAQQHGSMFPAAMLATLNRSLPPFHWLPNIQNKRWHKLAINCLINPLTVLYDCKNGELLNHPIAKPQQQLANEFVALANQLGMQWTASELVADAQKVIQATAQNRSSMLSDIIRQRRTEIDYLNGFVVQQCEQLGLSAPTHRWLWEHVKAVESRF
ncbi:ketopantoate reductase family protein [Pseudidiomarina aestuarii]|uniref:ketopantoate reductase family protein n=1 Tax=Pseudidiomarina aestuarii TaxID=624146 RepID=UPI003A96B79E